MELSEAEKEDYESAKTQMITRMAPVRFVSLEDFKERRLTTPGRASVGVLPCAKAVAGASDA